ncbi:MAG TPA: RidA family protein, partial [Sphingomonadales bacterium]|nr:RidA family protein [Sphingomonadales bacterium]
EHRPIITEVRNRYVNQANPPASTMIGVPALVMDGLLIEVEAVAVIDEARARGFAKVQKKISTRRAQRPVPQSDRGSAKGARKKPKR